MRHEWEPGMYKTESGKDAEVLAVRDEMVIGWIKESGVETWDLRGRYIQSHPSGWDLIPAKATGSEAA